MGKFNLSEAAKEVLAANVAGKKSGQESGVGNTKLSGDVAYGTKEVDVGHTPTKAQENDARRRRARLTSDRESSPA